MEFLTNIFGKLDAVTWGWSLIPILVILGIYFTLMTGFVQFRFFGRMFSLALPNSSETKPGQISGWQALVMSVGGRVGSGNLAGVAVAITTGGPGAIFWMWLIALVGMATSMIECTLAQTFKRATPDGSYLGGPAQYIKHGLGEKFNWLVVLYSICLLVSFGMGFVSFQGNTISSAMHDSFGISYEITAAGLGVLTAWIIFGGIQRIAKAADVVVPVMCVVYLLVAVGIIVMNLDRVPGVFSMIVSSAFGMEQAIGGGMGAAIAAGLKRGLFSNEAGLGSAPNIAATADVRHPVAQGITQSLSVFIDTIVICSCTAFIILLGTSYSPDGKLTGAPLLQASLAGHIGDWSRYILTFTIFLFAFSSVIYNCYLGEVAMNNLTKKSWGKQLVRVLAIGCAVLGAAAPDATAVFFFSDPMMGLLALVNLMVIITLLPVVLRLLGDYKKQLASGKKTPVFDPSQFPDLDVDHNVWKK